jgi:hypothetical protein
MNFIVHAPVNTIQYAYPNLQPKRPEKENNFKPTYANFFENSTQAKLGMSIQKQ